MPYKTIIAVVVVLIVALGVGAYTQYRPSRGDVLDGILPESFGNRESVADLPEPDRSRFTDALHAAVGAVQPGYRITDERLYVHRGGYAWDAVRKLSGARLDDEFGYEMVANSTTEVDGEGVDYLLWRPGNWVRRQFDDRVVAAVGLSTLLAPDYGTLVFGYFELRPGS